MHRRISSSIAFAAFLFPCSVPAQEAVKPVDDVEALFTSPDPRLHANKQVVYHIMLDLLEAQRWDQAGNYLTEAYIQHNPNVPSGRAGVVAFFRRLGLKPKPLPARLSAPVVSVVAEGDYVAVVTASVRPRPSDPTKTYTTTWTDLFRLKDGKADEHWDSAPLTP